MQRSPVSLERRNWRTDSYEVLQPSLCSKHPDVPELCRAAFMVYAALDLPQGVGDVETLVEAHGKELATAVGLCVKLLEHNFKLHSRALQKVISMKNQ